MKIFYLITGLFTMGLRNLFLSDFKNITPFKNILIKFKMIMQILGIMIIIIIITRYY